MPKIKTAKSVSGLKEKDVKKEMDVLDSYAPQGIELQTKEFLKKRVFELKEARKAKLHGLQKSIEDIWTEIDQEYTPHELTLGNSRARFEQDESTGLRSRLVKVGDEDGWQANQASPDTYVKVNTALAILIDQNPEAVFLPGAKRYEATTALAYANWKNSWEVSGAKQQLKLFSFNLARYGFAVAKTYPRIVEMQKRIRTEYHKDDASKDKYTEKRLVKFNDLCRRNLNPWAVWISETARLGDALSVDDWYHEEEYSMDRFKQEFPEDLYPNVRVVRPSVKKQEGGKEIPSSEKKAEMVTVGFYENQVKDMYTVWIPDQDVVLYGSPLPNDDGKLSLWYAPWTPRDDRSIYGIGIYEIIRQDSVLFDRIMNMTIDQLTLSIYKMFFHNGLDTVGANGKLVISPGVGEQVRDPNNIKFLDVPGPGQDAWRGLGFLQERKDLNSGVPAQLQGSFEGKTLGQDLQAKETALARMKTPLDYILDALQDEAYISLSWQKQILSTPEMLEWTDVDDLMKALQEMGLGKEEIEKYLAEANSPKENSDLLYQDEPTGAVDEAGNSVQPTKFANVYKEVALSLDADDKGELIESPERRFFRFGVNIPVGRLDWKGIVRIKPQSILAPSKELTKRQDLDMFNLVFPSIQSMAANPMLVPVLMPPIKQIIKSFEKDVKDWIAVDYLEGLYKAASQPKQEPEARPEGRMNVSIDFGDLATQLNDVQKQVLEQFFGIKVQEPIFVKPGEAPMQGGDMSAILSKLSTGGGAEVPAGTVPNPAGGAEQIESVAQIGSAPTTLGGAVSGASRVE